MGQKLLTDIAELSIHCRQGFSPFILVDCYDGMVVSWSIGTTPTMEHANILRNGIAMMEDSARPIVYSIWDAITGGLNG